MAAVAQERPRQFKLYLYNDDWEKLIHITDGDDCSAADAIRALIRQRYYEMSDGGSLDAETAADALVEIARRLRSPPRRPRRVR